MRINKILTLSIVSLAIAGAAGADTTTTIGLDSENTSRTTSVTATVEQQATVAVPTAIAFDVTNVGADTPSSAASAVVVTDIMLTAGNSLKISVTTASTTFGGSGGTPFDASDVRWTGGSWTNATPHASGTDGLSSAPNEVATCTADATACHTDNATFSLKAHSGVTRLGAQGLTMTWHFSSLAP
jgi:hypothetical protein